jgi:hypothetical protein
MIGPEWFFIGLAVWIAIREIRKWIELCMTSSTTDDDPPEMSDSVKHMYN